MWLSTYSTYLMDGIKKGSCLMLLELSVSLKGRHEPANDPSVDMNRIIGASGLHYETTNKGAVLEGSWEQLMAVAKKCHDEVLKKNDRFTTLMKAVDDAGAAVPPAPICGGNEPEVVLEDDGEWMMM
jgi:uncharacterized protein YqgV (UPF0045/DUF77 family)